MQTPNTVRIGLIAPIKITSLLCSGKACCCGHSHGAAAKESSARRILSWCSPSTIAARTQTFRESLREDVGGENIVIEWRYAAHAIAVAAWTGAAKYFFDHESHFSLLTRAA
jgi:hypothetical protein